MPSPLDILDQVTFAVLVIDADFKLSYLNQAAENLIGLSSDFGVGKSVFTVIRNSECTPKLLRECLEDYREATLRETTVSVNSHRNVLANISISPMPGNEILLEIEQLDRILRISRQDNMRISQAASKQLTRGMAHEIKNPLGGIRGAAQLLKNELKLPEQIEYTDIIIDETDRLRSLVDRMLGPNQLPQFESVNIHEILERVNRLMFTDENVQVNLLRDYDPSVPAIEGDFDQLIQAVVNIITNAIDAVSHVDEPTIRLRTRIEHHFTIEGHVYPMIVHVAIEDNGRGIPPEIQEQIFYPLVSDKADGTGLGLAITQSIVAAHHGVVVCESEPGSSKFHIYLPVNQAT